MARDLAEINTSGELLDIKIGGTDAGDSVATQTYAQEASELETDVTTILSEGDVTSIKIGGAEAENEVMTTAEILAPRSYFDYAPLVTPPSYLEGRLFYENDTKSLSYYNDVTGVTVNIGQEHLIRVFNNTGVTIPNGSVLRGNGSVSDVPAVALALADTYENATVLGLATHDIGDNTYGYITSSGTIGGDFSGITNDVPLYLSDTVPGGIEEDPPDLASVIGTSLTSGKILVNIENHKSLQTTIAWVYGQTTNYGTVTDTPVNIVDYTSGDGVIMGYDAVAGTLTTTRTGIFRVTINAFLTFTADNKDGRVFSMELYEVAGGTTVSTFSLGVASDVGQTALVVSAPVNTTTTGAFGLRMYAPDDDFDNVGFSGITFDIESIHLGRS